jgi:hypothetical protein
MTPLPAAKALDQFFLDARSRILDLAATLDRIDRGADAAVAAADPRVAKLREAIGVLLAAGGGRAEKVQQIFSLAYDPNWVVPQPRY